MAVNLDLDERGTRVYPWAQLKVGDLFYVPCRRQDRRKLTRRLIAAAISYRKKHGTNYTVRLDPIGAVVTRTL